MLGDAGDFFAPAGIVAGFFFLVLLGGVTLLLHHPVVFLNEGTELLS